MKSRKKKVGKSPLNFKTPLSTPETCIGSNVGLKPHKRNIDNVSPVSGPHSENIPKRRRLNEPRNGAYYARAQTCKMCKQLRKSQLSEMSSQTKNIHKLCVSIENLTSLVARKLEHINITAVTLVILVVCIACIARA